MNKIKIPSDLKLQLHNFLTMQMYRCQSHLNERKLKELMKINFKWLEQFCILHYQSRIQRAKELTSPQVDKATLLANEYIGTKNHDFFVTCVDGRNIPTIMFSKPPHVGGVIRTPAANVNGFFEGQGKKSVFVDKQAYIVQRIISLLRKKTGDTIYYGLDSHLGCAARAQLDTTEGGKQHDKGLRSDVLSKMVTARGILQLRQNLINDGEKVAKIVPIFFSYDPQTGGVISGLEIHINHEIVAKEGYTDQVLNILSSQDKVVRTLDLLKNETVTSLLKKYIFPGQADFRMSYQKSLLANWLSIIHLYQQGKGTLFKIIFNKLIKAYTVSGWEVGTSDIFWEKKIAESTLKQKAKFLLKNLVTRFSISGTSTKWPFNTHQEEMTVITEGGYGPFPKLDSFSIFSHDLENLISNTKLTIDLIRNFRYNDKIKNPVERDTFSRDEFFSAPVLISNKHILRDFQEKSWQAIKNLKSDNHFAFIDWNSAVTLNLNKLDIEKYILKITREKIIHINFSDVLDFVDGIYMLFNRVRIMMKDKLFRQMIINGEIVVLNTLVDRNRMPRYIIPFVI